MLVEVKEIADWITPASHYEIKEYDGYRIAKHPFKVGYYLYHGIDGYAIFYVRRPFECTTLLQKRPQGISWAEWMVDSPTDYRAMQKYAEQASGKVLTCGLGLGLLVHELCKNDKVTEINVVEISPAVIELVSNYLPKDARINIICQDFWKFVKQDNSFWDTIVVDMWVFWGWEKQVWIYKNEVIPANEKLTAKYPAANLFFHGFAGMPTIKQVDMAIENGDDVDQLIYGLNGASGRGELCIRK